MKLYHHLIAAAFLFGVAVGNAAEPVEGFTEPYRTIHVASAETGIVAKVLVREGDTVTSRQPLVALDDEVHRVLLEIARQQMEASGRLDSASAEVNLHTSRLAKLSELRSVGQAYQQEVERARADVEIAEGRLHAIQEELALRKLEFKKIEVQLQRRTIVAPVDGVVTKLTKNIGEYVSPVNAEVLTLVQLHPLRATFLATRGQAAKLHLGQQVQVSFTDGSKTATGVVENISELTDAESGTIPIKIRIDNRDGKYRSGERCLLQVN